MSATRYAALIANWNGAEYIGRCLQSVLAAARSAPEAIEVVVVDDASGDGSADLIAREFPSARLIRLGANAHGRFSEAGVVARQRARRAFSLSEEVVEHFVDGGGPHLAKHSGQGTSLGPEGVHCASGLITGRIPLTLTSRRSPRMLPSRLLSLVFGAPRGR